MKSPKHFAIGWCAGAAVSLLAGAVDPAWAEQPPAPAVRDGSHDFDFNIGVWHTHIKRVPDALAGSHQSVELNGTVTVRKVWGGRAELEEIEADGPNGHWEGLTLFLYNPASGQWSQSFIDSKAADLGNPLIGEFKNGRGELYAQDTVGARSVLIRGTWSDITPDAHHFEEDLSDDGGKTWAPAFIGDLSREKGSPAVPTAAAVAPENLPPGTGSPGRDGQHDFDFDLGMWQTHSSRLLKPLTGSTRWVEMDGTTTVSKVWAGRAYLGEYKADGAESHVELLVLRWYNPNSHQWNVDFATPKVGTLGRPGVGEFTHGRGDFYDTETINGRSVLIRFSIWGITADTAQSEQAFSPDGGKTWEVNWINKYTRIKTTDPQK